MAIRGVSIILTSMKGKLRQNTKNIHSKHTHEKHMCLSKKKKNINLILNKTKKVKTVNK